MREMKDSGVKWLGLIPNEWTLSKINSIYSLRNTKVSDKDYPPLSVTMKGIVPQLETAAKTNAHDDRKLVKKGDFAINSRSDRRGSCGISELDGSVSLINTVLKPNKEMNPSFYNWLFHSVQFADEFYANGHGIVDDLWTTGWQEMKKILIPFPPLQEQQVIANFLDKKCNEIDSLAKDIQKQIETLQEYKKSVITEAVTKGLDPDVEMKDSGVEWIEKIPNNWKISKVKHVAKLITDGAHITPDTSNSDEKFLSVTDMDDYGNLDFEHCLLVTEEQFKTFVKTGCSPQKNDVLISKDGTIGKTTIVCTDEKFVIASSLVIIRPDMKKINPYYLKYCLMSEFVQEQLRSLLAGSALKRVSVAKNANIKFVYTDNLVEQREIVSILDKKCIEINNYIEDKKKQLDVLAEYKKSLIYEYVTGKKEAPNYV